MAKAAVPAAIKSVKQMAALPERSFMPHYTLFTMRFATLALAITV
jgi:hypothetical protein